jgi:hypothetical protein
MHERLGALVVAARAALDEVGSEGERGPGETDQRDLAQLGDQQPHRGGNRLDGLGLQGRQRRDI